MNTYIIPPTHKLKPLNREPVERWKREAQEYFATGQHGPDFVHLGVSVVTALEQEVDSLALKAHELAPARARIAELEAQLAARTGAAPAVTVERVSLLARAHLSDGSIVPVPVEVTA